MTSASFRQNQITYSAVCVCVCVCVASDSSLNVGSRPVVVEDKDVLTARLTCVSWQTESPESIVWGRLCFHSSPPQVLSSQHTLIIRYRAVQPTARRLLM